MDDLDFDENLNETIPYDFTEAVESYGHDEQEYDEDSVSALSFTRVD